MGIRLPPVTPKYGLEVLAAAYSAVTRQVIVQVYPSPLFKFGALTHKAEIQGRSPWTPYGDNKMKIGIIGHGADKFTEKSAKEAKDLIHKIFREQREMPTLVSGHSPVGGIDIYAEEIAKNLTLSLDLKIPKQKQWDAEYGFKQRNLDIARSSDILHVILVDKYPKDYKGRKFNKCYHCNSSDHVKSGACWTAKEAKKLNKEVIHHIIKNE